MFSPIPVSLPPAEDAGVRRTRNVLAVTAALYGMSRLVGTALEVGLGKGWLATPSTMAWDPPTSWHAAILLAQSAADIGLVVAAILLIARGRSGIYLLRVSVCGVIAMSVFALIRLVSEVPEFRSQWSTPAAAAMKVLSYMSQFWLPLLFGVLTLLPLAPPVPKRLTTPSGLNANT